MKKNNSIKTTRLELYDVAKALGIIAIVLGHCCPNSTVTKFVYSFHLVIFFFISGCTYNEQKYSAHPIRFLLNRTKRLLPSYAIYLTIFTLTHNLFLSINLLSSQDPYPPLTIIKNIIKNFMFLGHEQLGGAMWFVPTLFAALVLFQSVFFIFSKAPLKIKYILISVLIVLIGCLGIVLNIKKFELPRNIHTSLLVVPVIYFGFLYQKIRSLPKILLHWYFALPCLLFIIYFVLIKNYIIELSIEEIGSAFLFYPISIAGIIMILYASMLITKINVISRFFATIGKYSFDIMALHFLVFKIVDIIYGNIISSPASVISAFPTAFSELCIVYLILGVSVPILIRIGFNLLFSKVKLSFVKLSK